MLDTNSITILTAITNNKDFLRDDFVKGNAKFIAYLDEETEMETSSGLWEIRKAHNIFKEPRRNAKIHKVLPHLFTDTEYSIWIDGNISLNITPEELVKKWLVNKNIATWKHFERNSWLKEAETVIRIGLDDVNIVNEQILEYRRRGYTENGLSECNVIVRRHTPEINRMNEKWWAEICRYSSRDQISFNCTYKDKVELIDGDPREHKDFNYDTHNF